MGGGRFQNHLCYRPGFPHVAPYEMLESPASSPTIQAALPSCEGQITSLFCPSPTSSIDSSVNSMTFVADRSFVDGIGVPKEQLSKKKRKLPSNPVGRRGRLLCTPCRTLKKGFKVAYQSKLTWIVPTPRSFKTNGTPLQRVSCEREGVRWSKVSQAQTVSRD